MQYTLRNIPRAVDAALRRRARQERRSLNDVAVEALGRAMGVTEEPPKTRSMEGIAGSWVEDPDFDRALEEQHRIDEDLWR